jgi:hypothetical protein
MFGERDGGFRECDEELFKPLMLNPLNPPGRRIRHATLAIGCNDPMADWVE